MFPNFFGFEEFWIIVTAGDSQDSPIKNLPAVNAIDSQKLSVIRTDAQNMGIAIRLPAIQTHAFIIGLPWPNLSDISPPAKEDTNPQPRLIRE